MSDSLQLQSLSQFALNDRLANYGDGVFTTMHVSNGKVGLLSRHLTRLVNDAAALGLMVEKSDLEQLTREALSARQNGVLKLLVGSGQGGRGYARPESPTLSVAVSWHSVPDLYDTWRTDGISLGLSPIKLAVQPLLAGLKHANRLEQVLIKRAMQSMDCNDCVVTDNNCTIIEASAANLFWYKQGTWFTPAVSNAGVNGVMRQFIIEHCQTVEVGEYHLRNLYDADAIMLTNALMQMVPVHTYTDKKLSASPQYKIQPVHTLRQALADAYEQERASA